MTDIRPIETIYNGYRFRSRLEARWAVFFDHLGITYEYEPEGLVLSDGSYYLPDFYLPQFHCYFEVKRLPQMICRNHLPKEDFGEAIKKISNGSHTNAWAGIIAFGDPYDHYMWIFCQAMNDSSGGPYDGPVVFGQHPNSGSPMLLAWDDPGDRSFITSFCESMEYIPMETERTTIDSCVITNRIIQAELTARQARFEHGENPSVEEAFEGVEE